MKCSAGNASGRWAVGSVLLVALLLSGVAWWYRSNQSRTVLGLWGPQLAMRLERAEPVVVFRLQQETMSGKEKGDGEELVIGRHRYILGESTYLSGRRGFLHFRHALVDSAAYDWDAPVPSEPRWQYLLRFGTGEEAVELVLSAEDRTIATTDLRRLAVLGPVAKKMQEYIEGSLDDAASRATENRAAFPD